MAQHTPGPWTVCEWTGPSGRRFLIETADMKHGLATIVPNENASTLLTMEQHRANAKLMSAAPDLLEELEEIVEQAKACGWHKSILESATRLISKVKGKE